MNSPKSSLHLCFYKRTSSARGPIQSSAQRVSVAMSYHAVVKVKRILKQMTIAHSGFRQLTRKKELSLLKTDDHVNKMQYK